MSYTAFFFFRVCLLWVVGMSTYRPAPVLIFSAVPIEQQVTLGNSRFDFVVTADDGSMTVVETKNVPLADYCDGNKKERAKFMGEQHGVLDPYSKMAFFPEGYRKKVREEHH